MAQTRRCTYIAIIGAVLIVIVSCVLVVTLAVPVWRQDGGPIVTTQQGEVRGSWAGDYAQFMGIPYALVDPDNPFGDALPGPIFEGIFEADDDSAMCPQLDMSSRAIAGNLDCLIVNVYVPRSASVTNPLPVMVWIHGGAFRVGSADQYLYGPQYLVRHEVILVTISYRLGPYGFMCLDTPSVPGNTGLKDQRRGLEWVHNNIAAFGGDVTKITAFGESAGAHSLEFHILSPGSNGLFQRAILQSGCALREGMIIHSRPSAPLELAQFLNFQVNTMEEALEAIKNVPTDHLLLAHLALGITFQPCLEKVFDGVENVITNFPDVILASEDYQNVPMIIGYNNDEKLVDHLSIIHNDDYVDGHRDMIFNRINASFAFENYEQLEAVTKIYREFYLGTKPLSQETVFGLIDFDSDASYIHPIERSINYRKGSSVPMYQYVFSYVGEINFMRRLFNITVGGAAHADELAFIFKQIYLPDENTQEDQLVIDRVTTMWTNFAKYGDPTPEVTELLPVRWPTVTDDREYLLIDSSLKIDRKPFHSRVAFWDLIFEVYGEFFRMIWSSCQGCVNT